MRNSLYKKNNFFHFILSIIVIVFIFSSCEKEITVELNKTEPEIVVEAYINQLYPNLNYVLVSRTTDYFNPNLDLLTVSNAQVFITEGDIVGSDTIWNISTKKQLVEILKDTLPGIYFDPTLQLIGKIGKAYKLEVFAEGKSIIGTTTLPEVVPLDSITYEVTTGTSGKLEAEVTVHYFEPTARINNYRAMYSLDTLLLAWGQLPSDFIFNDDIVNGIYRRVTYPDVFHIGDTITFYLISMDRPTYNFWSSYAEAVNNGGPYATPVILKSTLSSGIGDFSGFSVFSQRVIIK